eukprot:7458111-Pyramimonas_sp.AAC.1
MPATNPLRAPGALEPLYRQYPSGRKQVLNDKMYMRERRERAKTAPTTRLAGNMATGFPGNPSCPSGRPDHPP